MYTAAEQLSLCHTINALAGTSFAPVPLPQLEPLECPRCPDYSERGTAAGDAADRANYQWHDTRARIERLQLRPELVDAVSGAMVQLYRSDSYLAAERGRIIASGHYAEPRPVAPAAIGYRYGSQWPRITVAGSSSVDKVAREVARRVVPQLLAECAAERKYRAELQSGFNAQATAAAAISAAWSVDTRRAHSEPRGYFDGARGSADVTVSSSGYAEFKVRISAGPNSDAGQLARDIAAFLGGAK